MKTLLIKCPEHRQEGSRAEHLKPDGLVIRRGYGEIERVAGLVPNSVVIACNDPEAIFLWRKIVIKRLTPCSRILPACVS
jgi:hypothetical protein